jgi:hypothetical protein
VKFQKETALSRRAAVAGELGSGSYENVSVDAWKLWEDRMKMILNEYRSCPAERGAGARGRSTWKTSFRARGRHSLLGMSPSRPSNSRTEDKLIGDGNRYYFPALL